MVKRIIALTVFPLVLSFFVTSELFGGTPHIQFDKTVYDFGEAPQGDSVIHIFKFKNTGDDTLLISKVRSTCGCTAALLSKDTIPPGGSGEIKAVFKTGRYHGPVSKRIIVYSNDPSSHDKRLMINGTVYAIVEIKPDRIFLRRLKMDSTLVETISILPGKKGKRVKIENVETSFPNYIKIKTKNFKEKEKKGVLLIAKIGPGLPEGRLVSYIKADAYIDNGKKAYKVNIPISGAVLGPIELRPQIIAAGAVRIGTSIKKVLSLRATGKKKLQVKEVDPGDIPGLVVDSVATVGEWVKVYFTYKPERNPGVLQGHIHIKTNLSEKPELSVPFYTRVISE